MKTFELAFDAPTKGEPQREITIKGTSYKYDKLICEFEYVRRIGGKKIEAASHIFESQEQLDAENELLVTSMPAINILIEKKGQGTTIKSNVFQRELDLPSVPFTISDDFVRECSVLAYAELKIVATKI